MTLLIAGVLLWSVSHLSLTLMPAFKAAMVSKIGPLPWKGLFALVVLLGLVMIVFGWRSAVPSVIWVPPAGLRHVTMALVPIAFILFFAARLPTDIKHYIRHPQLTGVKLWAVAHLLSNGDSRSMVLFGGLLAWAVLEVIFINRRDGKAWVHPQPVGWVKSMISAVIALVIAGGVVYFHQYLSGIPLIG
ncbi:NnrU family protein [Aestuariicella hydrocarbonica]|uniref:NnrU family protein n=1 Tax=Pseudomaricurvus hydrocarbonicus TaxID=1470433 RepID=A0A9E5MQM1_9GAMM|nr:NnrU family protein [Aestuariicella hydrocarbonica]NHO68549.1 NnrU family protein [Aestuariicella hydrocarbonica]